MNPLTQIPPKVRGLLYLALGFAVPVLGALAAGYAAAGRPVPTWVLVAAAVVGVFASPVGLTAAANVHTSPPPTDQHIRVSGADVVATVREHRRKPPESPAAATPDESSTP